MQTISKDIQQKVTSALHWTDQQYNQFIYDCGVAYMQAYIPAVPQAVTQIIKTETFWNWWKFHWQNRENEFLELLESYPEHISSIEDEYKFIHDPAMLATAKYLNGAVLNEAYTNLIKDITNNQKKFVYA